MNADNISSEGMYPCPKDCDSFALAVHKFQEADHKCPNCGELGFFPSALAPCCSRLCVLQNEWAIELAARKAAKA